MLRRNILIFHQAALGDFIVTWPLAMALSRIFAQSRIIYVTHSQKGALAERVLRIESADSESGWHSLFSDSPSLPERPAKLLEGAQVVISFTAGSEDRFASGISRVAPQARVVSLDTRRHSDGHVTDGLLEQLASWPMVAEAMRQMLRSIESRGVGLSLSPQNRIVIHPGAGGETKRWPAERFVQLVGRLRDLKKDVRVLLGEVELAKWPIELIRQFEAVADVARPATLMALLDEISSASIFIGNDSGPGHLAGIIGVPVVSLIGGNDSLRWRPLGPRVSVIHSQNIGDIEVQRVYTEVANRMGDG